MEIIVFFTFIKIWEYFKFALLDFYSISIVIFSIQHFEIIVVGFNMDTVEKRS